MFTAAQIRLVPFQIGTTSSASRASVRWQGSSRS